MARSVLQPSIGRQAPAFYPATAKSAARFHGPVSLRDAELPSTRPSPAQAASLSLGVFSGVGVDRASHSLGRSAARRPVGSLLGASNELFLCRSC
jgi:hypothetical protein